MIRTATLVVAAPIVALGLVSSHTGAEIINVTIKGTVDYSIIQGNQASVPDGAPVVMSFNLDPTVYQNSSHFHTRAYNILLDSFSLTVGGQPITVAANQPGGLPNYFVLRDSDPVADGFFMSSNTDLPMWLGVNIPGLNPMHELDFLATYGSGTKLSSVNILDAVGTYDMNGITAYHWTISKSATRARNISMTAWRSLPDPGPPRRRPSALLRRLVPTTTAADRTSLTGLPRLHD